MYIHSAKKDKHHLKTWGADTVSGNAEHYEVG